MTHLFFEGREKPLRWRQSFSELGWSPSSSGAGGQLCWVDVIFASVNGQVGELFCHYWFHVYIYIYNHTEVLADVNWFWFYVISAFNQSTQFPEMSGHLGMINEHFKGNSEFMFTQSYHFFSKCERKRATHLNHQAGRWLIQQKIQLYLSSENKTLGISGPLQCLNTILFKLGSITPRRTRHPIL